ncbi:MAG TPA: GTP 3',8-cyclase MoaA [Anaerolineae bacterium]|nr:GTP 3',8-cyclase MoaA [Anaerolineae bacterium]HMR63453.1 GTP 3',8-cyclase MoaA [Anaerolineae bacterium]
MKDRFGREINYLRLSLTDRCNLRCVYCMPMHGLTFVPNKELLTAAELEQVVRAAVEVGFSKVRLTGGEPTLRQDIVEIVERINRIDGIREIAMTTNGYRLPYIAEALRRAGMKRVNIHVDSLNKASLEKTMRLGSLEKVWAGIEAAEQAGLLPIKLNAVITRGYNDDAAVDLARLTLTKPWQIRFIELMPFGGPTEIQLEHYVSSEEAKGWIERELGPLFEVNQGELDGEARVYRLAGAEGTVGFISPISNPYCDDCNRMRLTADGRLRLCLLTDDELNFRDTLRRGGSQAELVALFKRAIEAKPVGHQLKHGVFAENRTMSQIGG